MTPRRSDPYAALQSYHDEIHRHHRHGERVLECGSGYTTQTLVEREADFVTLEHSPIYHAATLELVGHEHANRVRHSPLRHYQKSKLVWYDIRSLKDEDPFSLVVCDGPPGAVGRKGLCIALPFLTQKWTILLDDAGRDGEKKTIELIEGSAHVESVVFVDRHAIIKGRRA